MLKNNILIIPSVLIKLNAMPMNGNENGPGNFHDSKYNFLLLHIHGTIQIKIKAIRIIVTNIIIAL